MRRAYLEFVFNYSPLIAAVLSLIVTFYWLGRPYQKSVKNMSLALLVIVTAFSLEFYPFVLGSFPVNFLVPIE